MNLELLDQMTADRLSNLALTQSDPLVKLCRDCRSFGDTRRTTFCQKYPKVSLMAARRNWCRDGFEWEPAP